MYAEILRYMGHRGSLSAELQNLISASLEKLSAAAEFRHVVQKLPCTVTEGTVSIEAQNIVSHDLAKSIYGCNSVYLLAATLGADVDRLISQRTSINTAEAFCLQACAAFKIEEYCDTIENGLFKMRFSPGY